MTTRIHEGLRKLETEENIRILLAVESGSRAWGFASTDSDYDVRFIYVHPPAWYLSIRPKRDVIERPIADELDYSGWDLPKALELFRKSNPPLLEWLQSPVVYQEDAEFARRFRALMPDYHSPVASMHHYFNMAENTFKTHLSGAVVVAKKYFYALRPLLAYIWIERGLGVVPMEFEKLLRVVADDIPLMRAIESLLEQKRAGCELDAGPRISVISDFIETRIAGMKAERIPPAFTHDSAPLDLFFVETLERIYGARLS